MRGEAKLTQRKSKSAQSGGLLPALLPALARASRAALVRVVSSLCVVCVATARLNPRFSNHSTPAVRSPLPTFLTVA